jgi:hypothetical protein
MKKQLLICCFPALVLVAQADIIAAYDFTGGSAASTDSSIYSAAGDYDARSTEIAALGAAFSDDSAVSSFSNTAFMRAEKTPAGTSPVGNELYHQFSLTIQNLAVGETLDITSLELDYFAENIFQSFFLGPYSDAVGYTGTGDKLATANIATDAGDRFTIDLTSSNAIAGNNFTGLSNGTSVEFRFTFADNSVGNTRVHRLDNIVVNGTVNSIPEPSSLALLAPALLLLWRKMQKH